MNFIQIIKVIFLYLSLKKIKINLIYYLLNTKLYKISERFFEAKNFSI